MRIFAIFFLALVFSGCHSTYDAQYEVDIVVYDLITLLETMHSKGELEAHHTKIKNLFNKLTGLMIYCKKHKQRVHAKKAHLLRWELERLYAIDGCRSVIERAQRDSVYTLDRLNRQPQMIQYS